MKKNLIIGTCLTLLLSAPTFANNNKVIGSGTITFTGSIVEGNCMIDSIGHIFKTNCWNGVEMEEIQYKIKPNEMFNTKLNENKGSMSINWIGENLAIMDIVYN
ncbi:type 1 fimbrial protein [Proteus vulgaris]|uniref:type 1 fimbrial protein n=1 Tax=Proteus vulgaris TaxID=585 RepID=UPI0018E44833|nr:type 1 fimbrial protein [Proteus vulgaris]MBI6530144.1 type 1 fimbrial protein [Proteus vulgaris]